MSINDLLDDEMLIPTIMVVFIIVLLFAIPIGVAVSRKTNENIYGDNEYGTAREEKNAKIIARRSVPHPMSPTIRVNMVVFELTNGSRIELAIKDSTAFGVMVEGDFGTLKYQGKKFVSFERGRSNEA